MRSYHTYITKSSDIERGHHLIDARGKTLGELASEAATRLMGKTKVNFCRYLDCGDFVKVINASQIRTTGGKLDKKIYYRHSGYPGGLKSTTLRKALDTNPEWVIKHAVRGMLPNNRLRPSMLKRLEVYNEGI